MAVATTALKNVLATAYGNASTHMAAFSSNPGTTGTVSGEISGGSYARKPITWSAASNGSVVGTVTFDIPSGATVAYVAVCGGSTGANLLDLLDPTDQPYSGNGTYTFTWTHTQA